MADNKTISELLLFYSFYETQLNTRFYINLKCVCATRQNTFIIDKSNMFFSFFFILSISNVCSFCLFVVYKGCPKFPWTRPITFKVFRLILLNFDKMSNIPLLTRLQNFKCAICAALLKPPMEIYRLFFQFKTSYNKTDASVFNFTDF